MGSHNSKDLEAGAATTTTTSSDDGQPKVEDSSCSPTNRKQSVYSNLGWLDRLLALWILLAIIVGIIIGNFADGVEDALQRGKFVDVSAPIGEFFAWAF